MTKLLICGGRDFEDVEFMVDVLKRLTDYVEEPITEVISGEAVGADQIGMEWANVMGIPHTGFPVTDSDWKRDGMKAAFLRNEDMLNYEPDIVFAFPGGGGTEHMVKISKEVPWINVIESRRIFFNSRNEVKFLSNFAEGYDFADEDGLWWKTSEHYYQAHKSVDPDEQFAIQDAKTAARAKELGNEVKFKHADWNDRKDDVMRDAIRLKFAKGTKAADLLLGTGWDYLIEYAPWGDTYWGVNSDKVGLNMLGRILNEWKFKL